MRRKSMILIPSTTLTSAQTLLGEWFDVDDSIELYAWLNVTAFAARVDETLTVTIERWAGNTAGYTTVLSFTVINTTGAQSEEKKESEYIGGRIRARCVTAGTWTSKSITFNVQAYGKG